jgi:hypothetical protein
MNVSADLRRHIGIGNPLARIFKVFGYRVHVSADLDATDLVRTS